MYPGTSGDQLQRLREEAANARTPEERLRALEALVAAAPGDPKTHFQYARQLLLTGQHDAKALEHFARALGADPDFAEARLGMGIVHHRAGDYDVAERMYAAAAEAKPRLAKAWLNLGSLAYDRRDLRAAARAYAKAVQADRQNAAARHGMAKTFFGLGKADKAIEQWEKALEIDPEHPSALRGLARALQDTGDERARDVYERAVAANPNSTSLRRGLAALLQGTGDNEGAEAVLRGGVAAVPESPRLWEALSAFLSEQGRPDDSVAALREGLVHTAGDQALRTTLVRRLCELERLDEAWRELRPIILAEPENAEARRLAAAVHACEGRHEEAAGAASVALRLQPACPWPRALVMSVPERPDHPMRIPIQDGRAALPTHGGYAAAVRGILRLAVGDLHGAAAYLQQAVQVSPETAFPRIGRALVYMIEARMELAYAELRTAAILQPASFQVQHLAGEAAFHTGRFGEAAEAFGAALSLEGVEPFLRALAFFCRARAYRKLGQTREAVECYLEAERLFPEYAPSFFGCGVALQEAGKPEEALRHYERCVDLSPRHARALMGVGSCLEAVGRAPEAVRAYQAALRADPDYAPPRYNLAVLLERTGDPERVAALLQGYLSRAPNAPNAADARRRLSLAQLRASGHVGAPQPEVAEEAPFLDTSQDDAVFDGEPAPLPIDPRARS